MKDDALLKFSKCLSISISLVLGFGASSVQASKDTALKGFIMEIQSTPAICRFDPNRAKKRKCLEGYSLNIQGLYPETSRKNCQTSSSSELSLLQASVVARVMPDESYRKRLWRDVGGCTAMNASQYFRTIINFADRLKVPTVMTAQNTQEIQLNQLKTMFTRLNNGLSNEAIYFQCQSSGGRSYLTSIKICYKTNGQYKSCSTTTTANCPNTLLIQGSY